MATGLSRPIPFKSLLANCSLSNGLGPRPPSHSTSPRPSRSAKDRYTRSSAATDVPESTMPSSLIDRSPVRRNLKRAPS
jgi:hypothetical protein